jgi:hypothetical protein
MELGNYPVLFSKPVNQQKSLPAWYQTLLAQLPCGQNRSPLYGVLMSNDNRKWINDSVAVAIRVKTGRVMNVTGHQQNEATLEMLLMDAYNSHAREPSVGTSPTAYHFAIRQEILRLNILIVDTLVEAVLFDLNKPTAPIYNPLPLPERVEKEEKSIRSCQL